MSEERIMNEYISKQELIKSIENNRPLNWNDTEAELAEQNTYDSIIDIINNFPNGLNIKPLESIIAPDNIISCIALPCNVGDLYYTIERTCSGNGYDNKGKFLPTFCDNVKCDTESIIQEHKFDCITDILDSMQRIGKDVFLTKEEAIKALKCL